MPLQRDTFFYLLWCLFEGGIGTEQLSTR